MQQFLHQFECLKNGSLFYFQSATKKPSAFVSLCPLCGSTSVVPTGRIFPALDELAESAEEYPLIGPVTVAQPE